MHLAPSRQKNFLKYAFSLVEVTLALGIIAFALIPLLGLLSVGLDSYRNAGSRDRAVQILAQISSSLRQAIPVYIKDPSTGLLKQQSDPQDGTPEFSASAPYNDYLIDPNNNSTTLNPAALTWGVDGQARLKTFYYDANGVFTTNVRDRQLAAAVVIQPHTSKLDRGAAIVVVTWPAKVSDPMSYSAGSSTPGSSIPLGPLKFNYIPQGHVEANITLLPGSL